MTSELRMRVNYNPSVAIVGGPVMKMFILILLLCLVPILAFGAVQLSFKDGSNLCGNYVEKDTAYCKMLQSADFCIQKNEITSRQTVSDCGEIDGSGVSTGYLKKHILTQADLLA
jgi:hypothetical protein